MCVNCFEEAGVAFAGSSQIPRLESDLERSESSNKYKRHKERNLSRSFLKMLQNTNCCRDAYQSNPQKLSQFRISMPKRCTPCSPRSRHLTTASTRSLVSICSITSRFPTWIGKPQVSEVPC
jgi:hypothetical protein